MAHVYENAETGEITSCRKRAVRWKKGGCAVKVYVLQMEVREYVYVSVL